MPEDRWNNPVIGVCILGKDAPLEEGMVGRGQGHWAASTRHGWKEGERSSDSGGVDLRARAREDIARAR